MSDLHDRGGSEFPEDGSVPERTLSAGETGEAVTADGAGEDAGLEDVIVGEIPDPHNLAHMVWTARCTVPSHGLLGTFENRALAEDAKRAHLLLVHGHGQLR